MSLLRKGFITTTGKVAASAIQVATGILVARWLGPAGTGQVLLPGFVGQVIGAIVALGLGQSSIYLINNRKVPIREVTTTMLWIGVIWFPFYGVVLSAVYLAFPDYFGMLPVYVVLGISASAVMIRITNLFVPVLLAELRARTTAVLDIVQALAQLVLTAALIVVGGLTVNSALLTPLAGAVIGLGLALSQVWRHIDLAFRPTRALIGQMLSQGIQLAAANIASIAHLSTPALLLRWMMPESFDPVGLFGRATSICAIISFIGAAAGPLLYSAWAAAPSMEFRARQAELATRLYALLGVFIAAGTALFAHYILLIMYGRQFVPATGVLRLLAISTVVQLMANALQNLFPAIGRPLITAGLFLISLLVNIVASLTLIPRMGTMGPAIGMLLASTAYAFGAALAARRTCGVRLSHCFLPRREDVRRLIAAAGMARPQKT